MTRTTSLAGGLSLTILIFIAGCAGSAPHGETGTTTESSFRVSSLPDLDDVEQSIVDPDRPTVLVFWATWCAPCRRELPECARTSARLAGKARFLGVLCGPDTLVDEEKARRIAEGAGVEYPQLRDREGALASDLGIEGTPTIVVVGPSGETRYRGHSLPRDWTPIVDEGTPIEH